MTRIRTLMIRETCKDLVPASHAYLFVPFPAVRGTNWEETRDERNLVPTLHRRDWWHKSVSHEYLFLSMKIIVPFFGAWRLEPRPAIKVPVPTYKSHWYCRALYDHPKGICFTVICLFSSHWKSKIALTMGQRRHATPRESRVRRVRR